MWNKNFICVILSNFLLCISHSVVNPLVASYTKYLNTSAEFAGFLIGMYFIVSIVMRPFAGPLMMKLDKRKLLILAFLIGCIASLGYAMFHSVPAFVAFRVLSGVQYSIVGGLIMTLAADYLPKEKLASGMGFYSIGGVIATAIAPMIGVELLAYGTQLRGEGFGFTLAFLCAALTLAAAMIPAAFLDPDRKTKEDIANAGAWYKNIFTIHALPSTILICLVILPYSMMQSYMVEFGKALGIAGISTFFIALAVALAISRPLSGFLTDKFGVARIVFPAFVLYTVALILIGRSTSLGQLLIGALILATGYGALHPSFQTMCMQTETPLRRSIASNTLYLGIDLGFFGGPFLGGFIYAKYDYAVMYQTSAIPVFIAVVCFAMILPAYKRRLHILEPQNK